MKTVFIFLLMVLSPQARALGNLPARDLGRAGTGSANFEADWRGNAARLGQAEGYEVDASYQNSGAAHDGVSAVIPGGDSGGLGAALDGDANQLEAGLGYGRRWLESLWLGGSLVASKQNGAEGQAAESFISAGCLYQPLGQLQLGLRAQVPAGSEGDDSFCAGLAWLAPPLWGAGEIDLEAESRSGQALARAAVEQPLFSEQVALRGAVELQNQASYFCGLGFTWREFRLDYAWHPDASLGDTHALSLCWRPAKAPPPPIQAPPPPTLPMAPGAAAETLPEPPAYDLGLSPTAEPAPEEKEK